MKGFGGDGWQGGGRRAGKGPGGLAGAPGSGGHRGFRPRPADAGTGDEPPQELSPEAQASASHARALRMLERRSYSVAELTRKLKEKGDAPDVAAATVERLTEAGLVNDATYAGQVARSYLAGRGASVRRVQMEMTRRGVGRELANEAIAQVRGDEGLTSEDDSVERAARKKLKGMLGLDALTRTRRLTAYLARRGYDMDAIRAVMKKLDSPEGDSDTASD